jgi:hypothetical protein
MEHVKEFDDSFRDTEPGAKEAYRKMGIALRNGHREPAENAYARLAKTQFRDTVSSKRPGTVKRTRDEVQYPSGIHRSVIAVDLSKGDEALDVLFDHVQDFACAVCESLDNHHKRCLVEPLQVKIQHNAVDVFSFHLAQRWCTYG